MPVRPVGYVIRSFEPFGTTCRPTTRHLLRLRCVLQKSTRERTLATRKAATKHKAAATRNAATKRKPATKRKGAAKRELINTGTNKFYVRRNERGTSFKEVVDVSRSLDADRRRKAKTIAKTGQGDRGDRRKR
jgi:hypothetical protein